MIIIRVLLINLIIAFIITGVLGMVQAQIAGLANQKIKRGDSVERDSMNDSKLNESKDDGKIRLLPTKVSRGLWKNYNDYSIYVGKGKVVSKIKQPFITKCLEVSDSIFWQNYLNVSMQLVYNEYNIAAVEYEFTARKLNEMMDVTCSGSFNRALYYHLKGVYQSHWLKDYSNARKNLDSSISILRKFNKAHQYFEIYGLRYNMAHNEYTAGNFDEAIVLLNQSNYDRDNYQNILKQELLQKCYERKGQHDKADIHHEKLLSFVKDYYTNKGIDLNKKNQASTQDDFKEDMDEIQKSRLKADKNLLIGICSLIIFGIVILYFYSEKINLDRRILRHEKSETIQRLDSLKERVIKNHIVLKNNMKIYIANLTYIKAEDHYLLIHTSDHKRHVVRGKLAKIKEELPPNFMQCHRSYIVNSNFITQKSHNRLKLLDNTFIPVSRSHKDKFKS